jgi:quercetin dioxygenase-like cupin family protein
VKLLFIQTLAISAAMIVTSTVAAKPAPAQFITQDQVKYDVILPDAVSFGTVSGNRAKGPHGTFVTIKKGAATPLHIHNAAYSAVVIKGKLENPIPGVAESEKAIGPGSYYHVPAKAKHITRCAADSPEDCMTFFWQATPFDFTPSK